MTTTFFHITEAQFERLYPKKDESSSFNWQKNEYSAVIFPLDTTKRYSTVELHRIIHEYSTRIKKNFRFDINIWNMDEYIINESIPFAVSFIEKCNKKNNITIKNINKLKSLDSRRMSENEYDEAGSPFPKKRNNSDLLKLSELVTENDFFETIFIPALEDYFGKERVLTKNYTPVTPRNSPQFDNNDVTWISENVYDCRINSFNNGIFNFMSLNGELTDSIHEKHFKTFIDKFENLEEIKEHYFKMDDEYCELLKKSPAFPERELESCLRLSPKNRNNDKIKFLEKEILKIKNQKLIVDGLYEMHHIKNWESFKNNIIKALTWAPELNEYYFVLLISNGTLSDGSLIVKKEIKAIIATNQLLSVIESI